MILSAITAFASPASMATGLVVAVGLLADGHVKGVVLLALAVVAGLPHGASDLRVGHNLLRSSGSTWWAFFLLGYLSLVGATLAAWALAPPAMLAIFLLLSVIHFGMQDAPDRTPLAVMAHGGVAIIVPALFHPQAVERIFTVLIGDWARPLTSAIAGPLALLWLATVTLLVCRTLGAGTRLRAERSGPALADLLLIAVLFAAAPPLVAFAFYFALLHTPRALLEQKFRSNNTASGFHTLGLTGIACLLGVGIFLFSPEVDPQATIIHTSFVLLSALTVPHMALEYIASSSVSTHSPPRHGTTHMRSAHVRLRYCVLSHAGIIRWIDKPFVERT